MRKEEDHDAKKYFEVKKEVPSQESKTNVIYSISILKISFNINIFQASSSLY